MDRKRRAALKSEPSAAEPPTPGRSFQAMMASRERGEREDIKWFLALAAVILLNSGAILWWAAKDTRPLAWDQAIHTKAAFEYRDRIQNGGFLFAPATFNYPPLYHLCLAAALEVVDAAADAGPLVNVFFLALLVISVFAIADMFAGKPAALVAAMLVSAYPIMIDIARQSLIDVALTALVAFGVLCLLRSDSFARPLWSAGFGVAAGLGMLTKWSAAAYLLAPFLFAVAGAVRRRQFRWLLASLAAATVIMAPWYAVNLVPSIARLSTTTALPPANGVQFEGWTSWLWYPFALFEQLNLPFVLLFLAGLVLAGWKREGRYLAAWYFLSIFLFSLIHNRNARYSMPALPAAAVLSVLWIPSGRRWALPAVGGLAAVCWGLYHFAPFDIPPLKTGFAQIHVFQSRPPFAVDWKHDELIRRVDELRPSGRYSRVVTLSNHAEFHGQTLSMTTLLRGKEGFSFVGPSKGRWTEFAEFILTKSGDIGPDFTIGTIAACIDDMKTSSWFPELYREAGRWALPDQSEAILYQLAPSPSRPLDAGLFRMSLAEVRAKNVLLRDAYLRAEPISPMETAKGRFKEIVLGCASLEYKGIPVNDVRVTVADPQLNVPLFMASQEIQLLGARSIAAEASLKADAVQNYLQKKARWLSDPTVEFQGSRIGVKGKAAGIPLDVALEIRVEGDALYTRLAALRAGGIPLPAFLARAMTDRKIPLTANRKMPFDLAIGSVRGDGQKLTIGPS